MDLILMSLIYDAERVPFVHLLWRNDHLSPLPILSQVFYSVVTVEF